MACKFSEFALLVDLHKFYFDLLLTAASFYLGIVGGLLAYLAKAELSASRLRLTLAVPILLSVSACVGYSGGYFKLLDLKTWLLECKTALRLGWAPHVELLPPLSLLLAAVAALVTVGLMFILLRPSILSKGLDTPASEP